ncbi:hypothetical protein GCM10009775_35790 [Microbacterium aoyamense]|uniref:Uncharacterized protein n=2 Tax=Microbacterium aoyamense TaxID=344166 RepID=A0ABN2Q3M5_9MICO|nr:hypothetical protein [Microbacterium aoyamense]
MNADDRMRVAAGETDHLPPAPKREEPTMGDAPKDTSEHDPEGEEKPGGLGQDGTIPNDPDGVAAGHTGEPSTFEPEEDEQA